MILPQLLISMLLFIVMFFGIGFLLNMLFRKTWIMAIIYPLVVIILVDKLKLLQYYKYITQPGPTFHQLELRFTHLAVGDICILSSGLIGAIFAGVAIKILRQQGYQMF